MSCRGKIYYLPLSYEIKRKNAWDKLQNLIWGRRTEILVMFVVALTAIFIIPVLLAWVIHQMIGV